MITHSPAIKKAGKQTVYVQRVNQMMYSVSIKKSGEYKLIDMLFGNAGQAIADLKAQGVEVIYK